MDLLSCINCRVAKRKCNKAQPTCSLCSKKNQNCIYPLKDGRKITTREYVKTLLTRIEYLEEHTIDSKEKDPITIQNQGIGHSFGFDKDALAMIAREDDDNYSGSKKPKSEPYNSIYQLQQLINMRLIKITPTYTTGACLYSDTYNFSTMIFNQIKQNEDIVSFFFERMSQTLPIVDPTSFLRFWKSVSKLEDLSGFCSIDLLGCILSYYHFWNNRVSEFNSINMFVSQHLVAVLANVTTMESQITSVQSLILLSIFCMSCGNETEGASFISRAVVLVQHYGFLDDTQSVIELGPMSVSCLRTRKLLFWCCFLVDRINSTVIGVPPYLASYQLKSLKESLYEDRAVLYESGFSGIATFFDTITFFMMESESIDKCYRLHDTKGIVCFEKKLFVPSVIVDDNQWKKDVVSDPKFQKGDLPALFLEISRLTLQILIYKTKVEEAYSSDPGEDQDQLYTREGSGSITMNIQNSVFSVNQGKTICPLLVCL